MAANANPVGIGVKVRQLLTGQHIITEVCIHGKRTFWAILKSIYLVNDRFHQGETSDLVLLPCHLDAPLFPNIFDLCSWFLGVQQLTLL